eukprot:scaffold223782_cov27-Tisochrysis_lutea.AAC.1
MDVGIANYQAIRVHNSVVDTGIPSAGPGGNLSLQIFWLTKEEKGEHAMGTSTAPAPAPQLTFLPKLQTAP